MATKAVTRCISLPPELDARLVKAAEEEDRPVSRIVRRALEEYFGQKKRLR